MEELYAKEQGTSLESTRFFILQIYVTLEDRENPLLAVEYWFVVLKETSIFPLPELAKAEPKLKKISIGALVLAVGGVNVLNVHEPSASRGSFLIDI